MRIKIPQTAFLITAVLLGLTVGKVVHAGTLSCSVTTAAACTGTVIYRMSGASNAHAELPSQTTAAYASNVVCCTGVTGLGTSCAGIFATALKLSGITNAHVQQNTQTPYANNACISVTSGGTVSVGYQATNCTGFDTTLGSMSAVTNAHVGNSVAYSAIQICGTATAGAAQSLTFSLGANSLNLGTLSTAAAVTGSHTMNVSTNATNGMSVTVSGSTLTFGANTITACGAGCTSSAGTKQFGINLVANTSPAVGANPAGAAPIGAIVPPIASGL